MPIPTMKNSILCCRARVFFFVDGEEFVVKAGDCVRVDPKGQRCLKATDGTALSYLCMQTRKDSLQGYTMTDGVMSEEFVKPSWLK